VIAIIAILASLLLPALSQAREKGVRVGCISNVRQQGMAYLQYAMDFDGQPPHRGDGIASGRGHNHYGVQRAHERALGPRFDVLSGYAGETFAEGGNLRAWICPAFRERLANPTQIRANGGGYNTHVPVWIGKEPAADINTFSLGDPSDSWNTSVTKLYKCALPRPAGFEWNERRGNRLTLVDRRLILAGEFYYPYWEGGPFGTARHNPGGGLPEGGSILFVDGSVEWSSHFDPRSRNYDWWMAVPQ